MSEQLRGAAVNLIGGVTPVARVTRLSRVLWVAFAVIAAGTVASGCGEDDTSATSCTADSQCPSGYICGAAGTCAQLPCGSVADCLNGDQGCIAVGGENFCSAVECGCTNCGPCPVGETCSNGTCGGAAVCSEANPCTGTDVCDAGACRPCAGAECGVSDCTVTGCTSGNQCNPTTKVCEPITGPTAEGCDTCTAATVATDCGTGWKCAPLPTGSACLPPCGSGDDCETGWICQTGNCTPASFRCDGCVTAGCDGGQTCNPGNNTCVAAAPACGACGNDWECGEGKACNAEGACVTRCNNGTCAAGGACEANARGIEVCDTNCAAACTPACSGATPICNNGSCVQCRVNGDCQNGQTCDTGSGLCTGGGQCSAPTPVLWQGQCVQCVTNNDCNGQFCNTSTNTCTSSQCASCAAPYPACVTIGTDSYCVQCAVDADCGLGGTCNTTNYACEGGTVTPTEKCTSDADCDPGASGYTLRCDIPSGYCYDVGGSCDNVTAYCVGTDGKVENCVSILELFGSGLGGGALPPEFTGGGTIPGFCGCTYPIPGVPIGGNCQTGTCLDLAGLLQLLSGGAPPANSPSAVCFPAF